MMFNEVFSSVNLPTGLVMSAITVIILVLYFVINTFVVEGLFFVHLPNKCTYCFAFTS